METKLIGRTIAIVPIVQKLIFARNSGSAATNLHGDNFLADKSGAVRPGIDYKKSISLTKQDLASNSLLPLCTPSND